MRISLLALDDVFDTGLSSLLDTFAFARALGRKVESAPSFDVRIVGLRSRVRTHHGFELDVSPWEPASADYLILPALFASSPADVDQLLGRSDVREVCEALPSQGNTVLAAACTSTFILASSGVLAGRRATTSWWLAPTFRERFPDIQLDASRMIVDAKERLTAGAAMAHVDLALWIVRRASPTLANQVAAHLMAEPRPSQAPFQIPDHLAHTDLLVEKFEHWVRSNLESGSSIEDAARAVGASQRSLERRVRAAVGKTPVAFIQDIRVEIAVHLLRTSNDDLEKVASRVGYADATTLRTLLRRKLGRGVRELR